MALRLWNADLGIPFAGTGDALFFQMLVKDALEQGWILQNPDLGAPFGQELHDYPVAGAAALHVLALKVLGLFASNPAAVLNAYFLLSFPLVALTAFFVLRWLRLSGWVAVAAAILFALAPYHFLRGEHHFFLAAYFPVPLAAYLVLATSLGSPLFARRTTGGRIVRLATPRTLATLGICVVVGLSDIYYVAFTVLLVASVALIAAVARRQVAALLSGAAVVAALVITLGIALSPNLVNRAEHGGNDSLSRAADESEAFSLNLTELIMPVQDHRLGPLGNLRERYANASRVSGEPAPLGLLAGLGFLWLLAVALALCLGAGGELLRDERQRSLAVANLAALLIGTTGGVSAVIAYAITPQLRTWSRLSIFIAFFALAALGLLADAAWARLAPRRRRAATFALAALAVLVLVAFLDQTSRSFVPPYEAAAAEYRSDRAFVRGIESSLGGGAAVFQLPYVRFPDQRPFARIQDYDPLRGYIHSRDLRWSYGAMRGRAEDWQAATANMSLSMALPMVSAARFQGVYLDRFGYADNGAAAEAELQQMLRVDPLVSANGRLAFFDLRPYNRGLRAAHTPAEIAALASATLRPVRTVWDKDDFYPEERDGVRTTRWAVRPASRLGVVNPSRGTRSAVLGVTLARPGGQPATTVLRLPGGATERVRVQPAGTPVLKRVTFPPGESSIEIATAAPPVAAEGPGGSGLVQLIGLQLIPEPALGFTRRAGAR